MATDSTELIGLTSFDDGPEEYDRLLAADEDDLKLNPMSSNISKSIARLQRILQFTPVVPDISRRTSDNTIPPSCTGSLMLQIDPSKSIENCGWKRYHCEVIGTCLTYRKEESSAKYKGIISCSYCVVESPAEQIVDENKSGYDDKRSYDDLYMGYLESQEGKHCFKVFSPDRIYVFRAETAELRATFVNTIGNELKHIFEEDLWKAKVSSAKELQPLHREQFMYQLEKHKFVLKSLQTSGLLSDISLLSSSKKEKSGVLSLLTEDDPQAELEDGAPLIAFRQWVDYFFVLLEGVIYYFASSRASIPTGFVTLKYASVSLDSTRLRGKEVVFRLSTPLRTLILKTKHVVALAEWITKLHDSIQKYRANTDEVADEPRTTASVLKEVKKIQSPVGTFRGLLNNDLGRNMFKDYLNDQGIGPLLPFWIQLRAFKKDYDFSDADFITDNHQGDVESEEKDEIVDSGDNASVAQFIFDRFLTDKVDAENSLFKCIHIDKSIITGISEQLEHPPQEIFKDLQRIVSENLQKQFKEFLNDPMFDELLESMNVGDVVPNDDEDRNVQPFPAGHVKKFIVFQKNKRKKEFKFPSNKKTVTIGRDVANSIVIDDNRVSRSHARVEYDDEKCVFVDVGSAHGTKINGKRQLQGSLQHGDIIEVGSTKMHFEITARKASIVNSFSNIFTKSGQ